MYDYATPTRPMTQPELDLICSIWADNGSYDPTNEWLNLWDGGDSGEDPEKRDAVIALAGDCGLVAEVRDGVLWVQLTKQIDDDIARNWV